MRPQHRHLTTLGIVERVRRKEKGERRKNTKHKTGSKWNGNRYQLWQKCILLCVEICMPSLDALLLLLQVQLVLLWYTFTRVAAFHASLAGTSIGRSDGQWGAIVAANLPHFSSALATWPLTPFCIVCGKCGKCGVRVESKSVFNIISVSILFQAYAIHCCCCTSCLSLWA